MPKTKPKPKGKKTSPLLIVGLVVAIAAVAFILLRRTSPQSTTTVVAQPLPGGRQAGPSGYGYGYGSPTITLVGGGNGGAGGTTAPPATSPHPCIEIFPAPPGCPGYDPNAAVPAAPHRHRGGGGGGGSDRVRAHGGGMNLDPNASPHEAFPGQMGGLTYAAFNAIDEWNRAMAKQAGPQNRSSRPLGQSYGDTEPYRTAINGNDQPYLLLDPSSSFWSSKWGRPFAGLLSQGVSQ